MSQNSDRNLLAASKLFAGGSDGLDKILARMRPVQLRSGQVVFSAGDPGDGLYVVLEGRVKLSTITADGRELSFAHAVAGDVFGEIATLDGGPRTGDATVLSSGRGLALSRAALQELMSENAAIATAMVRFLCHRLRQTDHKLEAIALHSIEVRLARFFLTEAEARADATVPARAALALDISQTDIGLLIGASRPKVNAALAALEADGAVHRDGNKIACDLPALRRCAGLDGFE